MRHTRPDSSGKTHRAALCGMPEDGQEELCRLLEAEGWDTSLFMGEEEFARAHFQQPFPAVFVFLPGVAGQELAVRARELHPGCALIWGCDDPDFARSAYRLRCTDFFQYPCPWERLQEAVARCEETVQSN